MSQGLALILARLIRCKLSNWEAPEENEVLPTITTVFRIGNNQPSDHWMIDGEALGSEFHNQHTQMKRNCSIS